MSDLCTGCNLCVDPCPTHCISLQPVAETPDSWKWDLNTIHAYRPWNAVLKLFSHQKK